MKKLFLVLSLAIISAMALGACASNNNGNATPGVGTVVPGTGATGVATGTGATAVVPGTGATPAATGSVVATSMATSAATSAATTAATAAATSGTPAATTAVTPAVTGTAGTSTPAGNGATVFRLSNLLDAKVVPSNVTVNTPDDIKDNQVLGTVDSVLVDPSNGNIAYVLLKPGEAVQNAPEGLVALPYSALKIAPRNMANTKDFGNDYHDYFTTSLTAQDIQKAPAVNPDNTDFSKPGFDANWRSAFSSLNLTAPTVGQNGLLRLNHFDNIFAKTDVVGKDGKDFGNVANFLVDPTSGAITYMVVSDGGFLGLGENYTPVPWKDVTYDAKEQNFVVDTAAVDFSQAPAFTSLNDFNTLGNDWEQKIQAFWAAPPTPAAVTATP